MSAAGPSVTRYELTPEQGVKVSRIVNLADDIKLNLAAADIRIEAPIPGKQRSALKFRIRKTVDGYVKRTFGVHQSFRKHKSKLVICSWQGYWQERSWWRILQKCRIF